MILTNARAGNQSIRPFFDTSDIAGEVDWRHRILQGLRHSKILFVCLSPNYFASEYCCWEWDHFLRRQGSRILQGEGEAIQAVRLVPYTVSDTKNAKWFASVRRSTTRDLSTWYTIDPQVLTAPGAARDEALSIVTALENRIIAARQSLAREYGNLRAANSHFVGRRKQLNDLHEAVGVGKLGVITALHGLGGIGKTELAVQYANEYARSFSGGIWWIDAARFGDSVSNTSSDLLKRAIASLADQLQVPEKIQGLDQQFDYVISHLRNASNQRRTDAPDGSAQVLIVLDNVENPSMLGANQRNIIGNCSSLSLLATTRNASEEWQHADDLQVIPLDGLDPDDALALMREWQSGNVFRDGDEDAAKSLVKSLDYYTLAVEQAAIYVGLKPEISIVEFLASLRAEGLTELDRLAKQDAELRSTMQHREKQLRLVLEQTLPVLGSLARQILCYAALFDPDAIAQPWLETLIVQHHGDQLEKASFADAWRWLTHRRLVTSTDVSEVWRMHRLVRGYLGDVGTQAQQRFYALIESQVAEENIHANSVLWPLNVLVAWVKGAKKTLTLWTKVRSFLAKAYLLIQKYSLGEQILEPTLLYLRSSHLQDPDKKERAWDYANALELSAFIQRGMGDLSSTKLIGQEVMALRQNLVSSMPDVTHFAEELSRSTAYFNAAIADASSYRPIEEEFFRNPLTSILPVSDEILRGSAYIDLAESSGFLGLQSSELARSLVSRLPSIFSEQSAVASAHSQIQKQVREPRNIHDLIKTDYLLSSSYVGCSRMRACEARAKRREARLEYAKFTRDGDRDCLELIDDSFEHLRDEKKYTSNTDRRMWRHVRKELRGESNG